MFVSGEEFGANRPHVVMSVSPFLPRSPSAIFVQKERQDYSAEPPSTEIDEDSSSSEAKGIGIQFQV